MNMLQTASGLCRNGHRLALGLGLLLAPGLLLPSADAGVQIATWTDDENFEYALSYMPDFDQRRNNDGDPIGFPGNGSMYCVPVSYTNALAYIANHGYPEVEPGQAPWYMPSKYDDSGEFILTFAGEMNTNAVTGTGVNSAFDALKARLDDKFVVKQYFLWDNFLPSFADAAEAAIEDHIVIVWHGFYNQTGNQGPFPILQRTGGHAVAMTRAIANEDDGTYVLGVRDSAVDDGDFYSQSSFQTRLWNIDTQLIWGGIAPFPMDHLGSPASNRYLEGYVTIIPKCHLSWESYDDGLNLTRIISPYFHTANNAIRTYHVPPGAELIDATYDPNSTSLWALAKEQTFYKLFPINNHLGTVDPSPIDDLVRPTALAFDRFRDLHIVDAEGLKTYSGGDTELMATMPLPSLASTFVIDDRTDEVVMLLPATGHLAYAPIDHSEGPLTKRLPLDVVLSEHMDMAINPVTAQIILLESIENRISVITENAQGQLQSLNLELPGLGDVTAIEVDDSGDLLVVSDGTIVAFRERADGSWDSNPDNSSSGAEVGSNFKVDRSRTNFHPDMEYFENADSTEDGVGGESLADCHADVNHDQSVDVLDLLIVLDTWDKTGGSQGDVNDDGIVNVDDVLAIMSGWGNCSG